MSHAHSKVEKRSADGRLGRPPPIFTRKGRFQLCKGRYMQKPDGSLVIEIAIDLDRKCRPPWVRLQIYPDDHGVAKHQLPRFLLSQGPAGTSFENAAVVLDVVDTKHHRWVVMEVPHHGTLEDVLTYFEALSGESQAQDAQAKLPFQPPAGKLTLRRIESMMRQMLRGIVFLNDAARSRLTRLLAEDMLVYSYSADEGIENCRLTLRLAGFGFVVAVEEDLQRLPIDVTKGYGALLGRMLRIYNCATGSGAAATDEGAQTALQQLKALHRACTSPGTVTLMEVKARLRSIQEAIKEEEDDEAMVNGQGGGVVHHFTHDTVTCGHPSCG